MKIVFFGSNNFVIPVLELLHSAHEVVAVITMPDAPVGRKQILTTTPIGVRATELQITTLKPERLKNAEFFEALGTMGADIFIVASYGKIIPKEILEIPPNGILNIHPSLLPKYRGPTPIQTALANGDQTTGVTIIKMDDQVDHGPVLEQKTQFINANDDFTTLANSLFTMGGKILLDSLDDYASGKLVPNPQADGEATFTEMLSKQSGKINWSEPAQQIYNRFRGYKLWPGIWTEWNSQTLKILECEIVPTNISNTPGTVIENGIVSCGGGTGLQINVIQLAGKPPTDIQSFIRGYPAFINSTLK